MSFFTPGETVRNYTEIRERLGLDLPDIARPEIQSTLLAHLAEMTFEIQRLKQRQYALLAALRAKDVVLRNTDTDSGRAARLIEIDARNAFDAANCLHGIEWEGDLSFRWTGPAHDFPIRIWLDRTIPIVFEFAVLSYGDPRNKGALTLSVDGISVKFDEVDDRLLRSAPFVTLDQPQITEVVVHVPWLLDGTQNGRPAPPGEGRGRRGRKAPVPPPEEGDLRVRGIAFTHLRFMSSV
ncbi:MAG: hypothetical protein F8N15_04430 [Methanobacterium sp.]|nr:hypothetical protein [Methanobacterium sp.]